MARIADNYSREIETSTKELRMNNTALTIRRATAADAFALRRLATIDSAAPPTGDVLLAQMGDELWAAVSVDTGAAIADPFRPSGDLVDLLRFRAERVSGHPHIRPLARLLPRAA
jgi:hypothetical protein